MAQQIRFCRTGGGRVAYATVGEGPPLVLGGWWVSHLELNWERPDFRGFVESLAAERMVIRYDPLGTGLSDRSGDPHGLDGELATLGAVLDAAGAERAAMLGVSSGAAVSAGFAARNPQRVTSLVLYGGYLEGSRITPPQVRDTMLAAVRSHWGLGSRMLADVFLPGASGEDLEAFARFQREAATAEVAERQLAFVYDVDVTADAPAIAAPTLVLHRRDDRAIPYALGREMAAEIPDARLLTLEGNEHFPWRGASGPVVAAIAEFLGTRAAPVRVDTEELSPRELEVLRLVADGMSDADIARSLYLSPHTVHRHVANIRTKLRQPSRAAAVAHASRVGLI